MTRARPYLPAPCFACGAAEGDLFLDLGGTRIVRCPRCGFHRVSPRADEASLREKVQEWAGRDVADPERLDEARSAGALRFHRGEARRIRGFLGRPGSLLDVGCSTGAFMEAAREAGFDVTGVELGADSSAWAREKRGLPVVTSGFLEAGFPGGAFDAVALYEVVEHLPDPLSALREAARVLRPGGVVALSTPNLASVTAGILGNRWWPINSPDEHIHLFTPATIGSLLFRAGFGQVKVRTSGIDPLLLLRALSGKDSGWEASSRARRGVREKAGRWSVSWALRGARRALDLPFTLPFSPLRNRGDRLFAYAVREGS